MGEMRPREKHAEPTQYASGYSLDLYCDHSHGFNNRMATFVGETFTQCARQAGKVGWEIYHETRTATCPACVRANKVKP
jgi:hypothetical protein